MEAQTTSSPQPYWRSQFLLRVCVETAPTETIYEALGELRSLMAPVAASNRAFLNAVSGILRNTEDTELRLRGAEPVRLGLVFDEIEKNLDQAVGQIRGGDEESLFRAARIAQVWGWSALALRDELNGLARFVAGSNMPSADTDIGENSVGILSGEA